MSSSVLVGVLNVAGAHRAPVSLVIHAGRASATAKGLAMAGKQAAISAKGLVAWSAVAAAVLCAAGVVMGMKAEKPPALVEVMKPVAASAPAAGEKEVEEAGSAGKVYLASFDVAMDAAAAEELRKAGTAFDAKGVLYQGYRGRTEVMGKTLREIGAQQQLIAASWDGVQFSYPVVQQGEGPFPFHCNMSFDVRWGGAGLNCLSVIAGKGSVAQSGETLRISGSARGTVTTNEQNAGAVQTVETPVGFAFEGTMAAGEMVVFLAPVNPEQRRPLVHAVVWQAFTATDAEVQQVTEVHTLDRWIQEGPAGARRLADRATAWRAEAVGDMEKVPEAYTKTLANGAEVRLLAVGSPHDYPFCWWKPDGEALREDWTSDIYEESNELASLSALLSAVVDVRGTADGVRVRKVWALGKTEERVAVGVGSGAWKDVVKMDEKGEVRSGAIRARLQDYPVGDRCRFTLQYRAPKETEARVIAVDKQGKRWEGSGDEISVTEGMPKASAWQLVSGEITGLRATDVDTFWLQTRNREWVIFEDFSREPAQKIPEE